MLELRVAIRALIAFDDLGVALQAVALGFEQLAHHDMADGMAHRLEFIGQHAQALASPAQRGLRVSARGWIHQRQQIAHQRWILLRHRLAAPAAASHRGRRCQLRAWQELVARADELLQACHDRATRQTRGRSHMRHPAAPDHLRFGRREHSPLTLVQMRTHQFPALSDR